MSASLSPATGGDEPTGRGPWSLGMPRFPGPAESRFRRAFAAAGASTRAEIHVLVLVILAVGFLTKLVTGHPTTVGIAFGVAAATHVAALLWGRHPASRRVSPSASAATFVGTQLITLICVVHYDGGAATHGSLPHIVVFAVLISVIFAHLTFGALVTVIGAFIGVLVLGEWLVFVFGAVATRLSDVVLSAVIVVGGLVAAREIELIARTSWVQRGRIATLHETDALTGIANRIPLVNELIAAGDSREPLSLLLLDIGGFKTFNDQHGHLAGDEVLRSVAGALRDTADGPNTLVARIAGKRFAVLWRGEQIDEAAAARLCGAAAAVARRGAGRDGLYVAAGLAGRGRESEFCVQNIVQQAEGALHRGRTQRRDIVATASPGDDAPATPATLDIEHMRRLIAEQQACALPLRVTWPSISFQRQQLEESPRNAFDAQGRRFSTIVLLILLCMNIIGLLFGGFVGEDPAFVFRVVSCIGIPVIVVALVLLRLPSTAGRWVQIFIATIVASWALGMGTFIVLGERGPVEYPIMVPIALIMSVPAARVAWRVAFPVSSLMLAVTVVVELVFAPVTAGQILSVTVAVLLCVTGLRSAFRISILHRHRWRHSQQLEFLGRTDLLTMLANRRAFEARLDELICAGDDVTVLLFDIDAFGDYNRQLGHAAGDDCLARIGSYLRSAVPTGAGTMAARVGGEEFAVLLTGTDHDSARTIWKGLSELAIPGPDGGVVTASAGVAVHHADNPGCPEAAQIAADLFARADRAMYAAKRSGRNRLRLAPACASPSPVGRRKVA